MRRYKHAKPLIDWDEFAEGFVEFFGYVLMGLVIGGLIGIGFFI